MADVRREQRGDGPGWRDFRVPGYEAYAVVGGGGHAVVVRGRQLSCNRTVAIKLLTRAAPDDHTRRRFDNERAAMGRLHDHPNIVQVVDSGFRDDGIPFLVMEYLPGGSLADLVKRDGRMGWQRAVDIGIRLAGALQTAHDRRILHRDVKPENVLFSATGEPKLGDFGIARAVGGLEGQGATGMSVSQAAPETFESRYSPRSDVYSLASSLMTVIMGRPPFLDGNEQVVPLGRILNEPPPNLRPFGVARPVCQALEKAMAKDPSARQRTVRELGEDLRQAQSAAGMAQTAMVILAPVDVLDDVTRPPVVGPVPVRAKPPPPPPAPVTPPPPPFTATKTAPAGPSPSSSPPDWAAQVTHDAPPGAGAWQAPRPVAPQPAPRPLVPPTPPPPRPVAGPVSAPPVAPPPPVAPEPTQDGVVVPPGSVVIVRQRRPHPPRRGRPSGLRVAVTVFLCVAVVAGGTVFAADYARRGYHVGVDGRQVLIFKGRPGGFLFFQPRAVESTSINVGDLEPEDANALVAGVRRNSLGEAQSYVSSLRTTTTTSAPTTSTTVAGVPARTPTAPTAPTTAPAAAVISEIGPVPAGRVVVSTFSPSLRFSVNAGWRLTEKPASDLFELSAADGAWHLTFVNVKRVYSQSSRPLVEAQAQDAAVAAPADLNAWLTQHSQPRASNGLLAATPTGAMSMRQLDATVAGGYAYENCTETCLLLFQLDGGRPAVKLASERIRFYVVTTASHTIVVSASTKRDNFDALTQETGLIMRSLVVG